MIASLCTVGTAYCYSALVGERSIVMTDEHVCLSVPPHTNLTNHRSDLHQISCACYIRVHGGVAIRHFRFVVDDVMFAHDGPE